QRQRRLSGRLLTGRARSRIDDERRHRGGYDRRQAALRLPGTAAHHRAEGLASCALRSHARAAAGGSAEEEGAMKGRALVCLVAVLMAPAATIGLPAQSVFEWKLPNGFPAPPVPADNPMSTAKAELGRYLFYDTRLSGNGTQACATCHEQARAFTDGR